MEEIFRPIKNYEGYYEVSNLGRVKSLAKEWSVGRKGETILKAGKRKIGYDFVVLCVDKNKKYVSVHRLVAEHFCENPNSYNVVNHKDSDRQNNNASNLEWTTNSGNAKHGFDYGFRKGMKGVTNGGSILNTDKVIKIRELYYTKKYSQSKIAEMFSIKQTQVSRIVLRKQWQHI